MIKANLDISNSLLLYGPPGCGKTTTAQYIAHELRLPLITVRLDGLISSLLGSTAKNMRKIFEFAARQECVLFLDEFDVVAKLRDDKNELGELKRVVNSLIQNIDSLNPNSVLIAATNHHELLDSAIWRRFSRVIKLDLPNREEIYQYILLSFTSFTSDFHQNEKRINALADAFCGLSYSEMHTIFTNSQKNAIINNKPVVGFLNVLFETYLRMEHNANESGILKFLIDNGVTQKEINTEMGYSLRRITKLKSEE